jgi:hypothetical protein
VEQIHGGYGYDAEYPAERFYRDVRLFRLCEGTSQIQQIVIARGMVRATSYAAWFTFLLQICDRSGRIPTFSGT